MTELTLRARMSLIQDAITLPENYDLIVGKDLTDGRYYFQVRCWREDVITHEMGYGYGGQLFPKEESATSEIVQGIFGLYKGYVEHEARETFKYKGRRIYGPHNDVEALWEAAAHVVKPSQRVEGV